MKSRKKHSRKFGRHVSCSTAAHKMSTRRGPRCVRVCQTPGGWKIPRFAKSSTCRHGKARSWKSIAGGR